MHRHGLSAANLKMTNVPEREGKRSQNMSQNWAQPKKGAGRWRSWKTELASPGPRDVLG